VHEKDDDPYDDGSSNWQAKFMELNKKYNNEGMKKQADNDEQNLEDKFKQDAETYGSEFSFVDYLLNKRKSEYLEKLENTSSTNPRKSIVLERAKRQNEKDRKAKEDLSIDIRTKKEKEKDKIMRQKNERRVRSAMLKASFEKGQHLFKDYKIIGRVSPGCKEEIYRNYIAGWTVKDLSYRYGIVPERVKFIVFWRDYFWKEIYPKIGETGLKQRLVCGLQYAKIFGYIDYGKDLEYMALREQGIKIKKISQSERDKNPTEEDKEKISKVLKNQKSKMAVAIPVKFIGKGPKGYLIKELYVNRGPGSKRVSKLFQRFYYYKDLYPHFLPKKVLERKELGGRIATMGSKF
jgi:hypothetical protein